MTNKTRQFILDLEASGLPRNSFGAVATIDGTYVPMDLNVVRRNYSHIDIYQFGLGERVAKGKMQISHTSIVPPSRGRYKAQVGNTVTGYEVVNGIKIPVKQYITQTTEREELTKFLSRTGKLKESQVRGYVESVGGVLERRSLMTNIEATIDGETINASKWAFMNNVHTGDYRIGPSEIERRINSEEGRKIGATFKGKLTDQEFRGRGKNSLYDEINNIVSLGSKDNPVQLGVWNPGYDIEVIRAVLDRNGETDLLKRFEAAISDGTIELRAIEHEWQQIAYRIVKENPEMRSAFKIRWSPSAFRETGGRSGMIANTFEEFLYSTNKWSAQHVANVFNFTDHIQNALPGGIEEHIASFDVKLTEATQKVFDDLLGEVNALLPQGRAKLRSVSQLSKLTKSDGKVVTKALESLLAKSKGSNLRNATKESVLKAIKDPAAKIAEFEERQFGSLYANAVNKVNHASALLKYGAPIAIGASTLLMTYGLGGDERSTSILDKIPNPFKLINNLKGTRGGRINDSPDSKTHVIKTLAQMTAIPTAALWAVGYVEKVTRPDMFGISRPINTIEDGINEFFRTARYGAKRVEKAFPLAKIVRISDISDYIFGDKTYGQMENGVWKGKRWDTFRTDSKGPKAGVPRFIDRFEHGVAYESLLDAARLSDLSEREMKALDELFTPKYVMPGVARRSPMVTVDEAGKAVVFGFEYDTLGNKVVGGHYGDIWQKGIKLEANISITGIRHADQFGVGKWSGRKLNSNAIAFYAMQKDLVDHGHVSKNTLREFIKAKGLTVNEGTMQWAEEQIKHLLDVGPKGVGEAKNVIMRNGAFLAQNTKTLINVRSLTGKNKWTIENIKAITKFASPIIQNYTIEGMNNFLERPFEVLFTDPKKIKDLSDKFKASDSLVKKATGKALSFIAAPHLGLPMYTMKGGMAGYLSEFALKRVLPAAAGVEAFRFIDHALGTIMQSPTGRGPLTMLPIRAYEGLQLLYSKVSDITGLTSVAKKQENVAPGSTGLGIFASAASMASTLFVAQKAFALSPETTQSSIKQIAINVLRRNGNEKLVLKGTNAGVFAERSPMEKFASWAINNPKKAIFAMGMIPMIPFIPGFIGSNKTYQERKAEFQGKKEVAIRKNRGWLLSTSPIQGGRVSHFREHAASLIEKDWENRGVVWPSYWKRLAHNITGGLYGRYMLENYHAKDQPVYQSAPYAVNIPVIGPLIAGTVGKFIKPTIEYHKFGLENQSGGLTLAPITGSKSKTLRAFGTGGAFKKGAIDASRITTNELAEKIGLTSENGLYSTSNKFTKSLHDFIGFRGFGYEAIKSSLTGLKTPDEFTPYAQSGSEFYNTSQQMWQYQAGDVTWIGGEFLRRIFQYPDKRWTVNKIQNEFYGVSWIPQGGKETGKASGKDITHGTTFDKVPMGWLHATRRGWEMQFPEVKGVDLELYPDPIRVEILKHMNPFSPEFNVAATRVKHQTLANQLNPEQEQRYYESLRQVGELKEQLYAYDGEASYDVSTTSIQGRIIDTDDTGRFTLDTMPGRTFKLAGVSLDEEDIRARLLREHQFKDQFELSSAMKNVIQDLQATMSNKIAVGRKVSVDVAAMDQMINPNKDIEAIMGSLNTHLIDKGAGFINTGNLSKYNIFQKINGFPSKLLGKYWDTMTSGESFWINKLKPQRDYLSHYKYSNVYNRDVKLWNHPIEQIFKPMIASTLHKFGIDKIPQFTIARRRNQEYWDILKYVKGKMLENKTGNPEYRKMWKSTMIGSDPVNGTHEELLKALPENEKAFFSRFANEPNPKKRGEILKYIPEAQRRLYISLWAKQRHAANLKGEKDEQEYWDNIKETEGFGMTADEERQWRQETGGKTSKADWKRLKYIEEYSKSNYIPGSDSDLWREDVDIENVELLSLREDGENIEDYGFFEDKARIAAFDSRANLVAMHLKSQVLHMSSNVGSIAPYIASNYNAKDAQSNPSMTINPLAQHQVQTNGYERLLHKNYTRYIAEMADDAIMLALRR